MAEISKRFTKVSPDDAKQLWEDQYAGAIDNCHHTYVHGKCKSEAMGVYCEVGRRTRTYFVLSGSVLSVWPVVEEVLSDRDRRPSRMQEGVNGDVGRSGAALFGAGNSDTARHSTRTSMPHKPFFALTVSDATETSMRDKKIKNKAKR
ncbi:hypothetical protein TELCIR_01474 [Teladorsagia circumcincta]|uniref:SBNO alpha/beta domain-containing protein n=1 Tax=Teladorsagia circumcincta TaxID=45464 RepID=A0A2G9V1U9_TELCI|nr:hypothetical protein TELCIR_01474 [Teladorsagia circumcincta]